MPEKTIGSAFFEVKGADNGSFSPHVLVLGGARSGKSAFALRLGEDLLEGSGRKGLYVATAQAGDAEMEERIRSHREGRGDIWETVEEPCLLADVVMREGGRCPVILVDCLTLWVFNLMHDTPGTVDEEIWGLFHALSRASCPVVMVSNEVGLGIVPLDPLSRAFRDRVGRLHQDLARLAGAVYLVVAGLPIRIKGGA